MLNKFWAGRKILPEEIRSSQQFSEEMCEIVFKRQVGSTALLVCRDGMILIRDEDIENEHMEKEGGLLDMNNQFEKWTSYLRMANVAAIMLDSAFTEKKRMGYFQFAELTNQDAFLVNLKDEHFFSSYSVPIYSHAEVKQKRRHYPGPYLPYSEPFSGFTTTVEIEVLEYFASLFFKVIGDKELLFLLEIFSKGYAEYKIGQFENSALNIWLVVEHIIPRMYEKCLLGLSRDLGDGRKTINSERKKNLSLPNVYTMSVKLNFLELMGSLDFDLYHRLDLMRKQRNDIVHQNSRDKITYEKAHGNLKNIKELINAYKAFDFYLNDGLSISGI